MKLLLHTCCGPCTIYPVRILRELMTGVALRKKGITDPYYKDPNWIRHKGAGK